MLGEELVGVPGRATDFLNLQGFFIPISVVISSNRSKEKERKR